MINFNPEIPAPELDEEVDAEIEKLAKAKEEWLDRVMKFVLPPKLYQAGKERKKQKAIMRFLAKNKYHIREVPDQFLTQFCRGNEVVFEFKIDSK